jgi:hypothetical protein
MDPRIFRFRSHTPIWRGLVAVLCAVLLLPGEFVILAQEKTQTPQPSATPAGTAEPAAEKLPQEQLDALVAPIALYPDPLLAQTLVASTYPLEIIQLQQWMAKNPDLKDKKLADAVAKQPWDPAIQSMAAVPEVVKRLSDDIQWTTDLGNAFLAQQSDVMDAVQRMRSKAKDNGALESNEQQKVETKVVEEKTVIVVQPSNPEVIYVPSYSPVVVYGPPIYPYPPIYYPPYPPGAAFVSFSFGVMMGAAIWGGSCCGCGWGGNNVNINVNNNFNQINHRGGGGNNNWQHNAQHRGAAPYSDKATANKYGGSAKGQSPGGSKAGAKQQPAGGSRGGAGASAKQQPAGGSRGGAAGPSTANRGGSGGGAGGGGDRIGSQNIPKSSASKAGGFGGGSSGYSGSSARASSSRGASSMGSRGGGSRGGGGGRRR